MITNNGMASNATCLPTTSCISWSAIFIGAFVGVGLGFLLNLFGLAIGLSIFTTGKDGAMVIAIGGIVGILIGTIAAMITAGYAAGHLARVFCMNRHHGILYGFATWSLALFLTAIVAAPLSHYIADYSQRISHSALSIPKNQTDNIEVLATNSNSTVAIEEKADSVQVKVAPASIATGAFIVFALFFIGAISSCIGACWGMGCCKEREIH
ncbi:MAG: hypothetical protein K2X39_07720 [Silvanigrellaceae bacterium]|nr:hypothetical protein [Silvanigrellaceae bacterium]